LQGVGSWAVEPRPGRWGHPSIIHRATAVSHGASGAEPPFQVAWVLVGSSWGRPRARRNGRPNAYSGRAWRLHLADRSGTTAAVQCTGCAASRAPQIPRKGTAANALVTHMRLLARGMAQQVPKTRWCYPPRLPGVPLSRERYPESKNAGLFTRETAAHVGWQSLFSSMGGARAGWAGNPDQRSFPGATGAGGGLRPTDRSSGHDRARGRRRC